MIARALALLLLAGCGGQVADARARQAAPRTPERSSPYGDREQKLVSALLDAHAPKVPYRLEVLGTDAPGEITVAAQFDTVEAKSQQILAFTFVSGPYACEDEPDVSEPRPLGSSPGGGAYEVIVCAPNQRVRIVASEILGEHDVPHELDVQGLAADLRRRLGR